MERNGSLGFRGFHPLAGCLYFVMWIVLLTIGFHVAISAACLVLSLLLAWTLGLGKSLRRNAKWFLLTIVLMTVINPLVNRRGRHILFYFLDQPVTLEAVVYGLHTALMIVGTMSAFISFQSVIHPQRFLYLFSKTSPKAALLLMMAMRFTPLFARRLREIAHVQQSRGISVRSGPLLERVKGLSGQLRILVTRSLEDAVTTADAMTARGYGTGRRTTYEPYRFIARDGWFIALCAVVFVACMAMWLAGWGRMGALSGSFIEGRDLLAMAGMLGYAAIPLSLEGKERWWWLRRSLRSSN